MTLPVPDRAPIALYDRQRADDFAALGEALAAYRAQQHPMTVVYAPTTVVHHHTASAPAAVPAAQARRPGHQGIDIDATGYASYFPPTYVPALAPVPERRSLAPLGFLVCGWSTVAAAFGSAVTGGNPAAVGATLGALTGTALSIAAMYRRQA